MDELFSAFEWVDRFGWTITGKSEDLDFEFKISCPDVVLPLVALSIYFEAKNAATNGVFQSNDQFAAKLQKVLNGNDISIHALSMITGLNRGDIESIANCERLGDVNLQSVASLMVAIDRIVSEGVD